MNKNDDALMDILIDKFQHWGKDFPMRDELSFIEVASDFASQYDDVMNNYNEDTGQPGTRNSDDLMELFNFCLLHPEMRLWQAISAWTGYTIYATQDDHIEMLHGNLTDTYNWENKLWYEDK